MKRTLTYTTGILLCAMMLGSCVSSKKFNESQASLAGANRKIGELNDDLENTRSRIPAGRLITPEDVSDVVLLLCSDKARMIQGQSIVVDGGYSIRA